MYCSRHRIRCQNQMNKEFSDLNNLLTKIYPFFSSLLSPTLVPTSVKVFDFISDVSIEITKNLPTFYRFISRVILWCRTPTRDVYLADKSDTNIESRNSDFRDQTWVRHESAKWLFSDCSTNVSRELHKKIRKNAQNLLRFMRKRRLQCPCTIWIKCDQQLSFFPILQGCAKKGLQAKNALK